MRVTHTPRTPPHPTDRTPKPHTTHSHTRTHTDHPAESGGAQQVRPATRYRGQVYNVSLALRLLLNLPSALRITQFRRRRLFHSCAGRAPTLARGRPTPRMAVVSVWSLEEDTLKANFT